MLLVVQREYRPSLYVKDSSQQFDTGKRLSVDLSRSSVSYLCMEESEFDEPLVNRAKLTFERNPLPWNDRHKEMQCHSRRSSTMQSSEYIPSAFSVSIRQTLPIKSINATSFPFVYSIPHTPPPHFYIFIFVQFSLI